MIHFERLSRRSPDIPIVNRIAAFAADMKKWRRNIHQNPELGLDCYQTASFIEATLREFGISEIHTGIAQSGLVAIPIFWCKGFKPFEKETLNLLDFRLL